MAQPISKLSLLRGHNRPTARELSGEHRGGVSRSVKAAPLVYQAEDVIGGKYQLTSLLGQGGMGAVWRARNLDLDAEVAIKLIGSGASSAEATDRLLREAQSAAKLDDPAILRVFDFGKSEHGDPFIVMELLNGEDLGAAIKSRGRLSPKRAVRVLLPIVRALTLAHEQGIVHRDLKPENVFLAKTAAGLQPKIVDFGIAQLDRTRDIRLTTTGALMGSPLYMSPEQAKGEPVDYRADIWSLSVVLYEAITGKVPFEGPNYNAVLCAVMVKDPQRPTSEPLIDDELWSILQRGMHKDPSFRFASMREMGKLLSGWLIEQGEHEDITGASLRVQWQQSLMPVDQLTTVFPPNAMPVAESLECFNPTQRISRRASAAAAAPPPAAAPARGTRYQLKFVALGALGLVALVASSIVLRTPVKDPVPEPSHSQLERPGNEAAARTARTEPVPDAAATPTPASPDALPDSNPRETTSAESEQASAALALGAASASAPPGVAPKPVRPRRSWSQANSTSQKRAAKLKNPFAP